MCVRKLARSRQRVYAWLVVLGNLCKKELETKKRPGGLYCLHELLRDAMNVHSIGERMFRQAYPVISHVGANRWFALANARKS